MKTPQNASRSPAPHQLGGVDDFAGPVPGIDDTARFHEAWEARLFGLMRAAVDLFAADHFRHAIERIDADEHHRLGYFERWLAAVERLLVERGHLTADELDAAQRRRLTDHDLASPHIHPHVAESLAPPELAESLPIGTPVRLVDGLGEHHRLPDWARGRRGTIRAVRGEFELPDLIVAGSSDGRHYTLYSVEIPAPDVFPDAHASDLLYLDAYHPYLQEER